MLLLILALKSRVGVYDCFIEGAGDGMSTIMAIFPPLVAIMSVSVMLRESGAIEFIANILAPITKPLKIPAEILPLALIRPLSGGASVGLLTDLVITYGADSRVSKMACILCASTETTFYTLMVYFRNTEVKYTKRVLMSAIFGDLVGILCASLLA